MGSGFSKKSGTNAQTSVINGARVTVSPQPKNLKEILRPHLSDNEGDPVNIITTVSGNDHGIHQILQGDPDYGYRSNARIVRIFTSSTFTDTKYERNYLIERVYPKLKEFCQEQGYEFQVVDMRWGVREDAENDHMAIELCLKELKACQQLSTGPNFVSFLSHKYGHQPLPRTIDAEEFDIITQDATEEEDALLEKWFILDENAQPPVYVMQPVNSHLPDFLSDDVAKRRECKQTWWEVFCKLRRIVTEGAKKYLSDPERRHHYLMSVTERELEAGILKAKDPEKHCLWFKRVFDDIESVPANKELSRFYECLGSADSIKEARHLLGQLRDDKLKKVLGASQNEEYHIRWAEKGINATDESHMRYLEQLCVDFERHMKRMITSAVKEEEVLQEVKELVIAEVMQHSAFRHSRCRFFCGRLEYLKDIEEYVKGPSHLPLIIYAETGSGKTSLMARAAKSAWHWFAGRAAIVYRFLGTSHDSSSIRPLLASINRQLCLLYAPKTDPQFFNPAEMKTLLDGFLMLLKKASKDKPLVLLLDSLDQIDTIDGGRQMEWLPRELPANVKVILSMLPHEKYGVFPRCKAIFPKESGYLLLNSMSLVEVDEILTKWLASMQRTLTPLQRRVIQAGFKHCSSPLYLKLAIDESLRWHSYDPPEETRLRASVSATVKALFNRIERRHGQLLVSFALSYLSAAPDGLSESEMEDLLSLNDIVLGDVYQFWVPPVRRLPPLLWVRIKSELDPYLAKRGVDGMQVISWYYRPFFETAREKYLANQSSQQVCHWLMAEYYLGKWADCPKPYKEKSGETKDALRYVAKQPLMFDNGKHNLRKLNQLPYHLQRAEKLDLMKEHVLCNYEFLLAKISALGCRAMLSDFKVAQMAHPRDQDIAIVQETLQLSQDAILARPQELAGQLIGRMHMSPSSNRIIIQKAKEMLSANQIAPETAAMVTTLMEMLEGLVEYQDARYATLLELMHQASQSSVPVLLPNTACLLPPGGQLLHKLSDHLEKVNDMDIDQSGEILATGSDDNTVKFWNVRLGELLVSCQVRFDVVFVKFYASGKYLAASTVVGEVFIIDVQMGTILKEISCTQDAEGGSIRPLTVCQTKAGSDVIVVMRCGHLDVLDGESGQSIMSCEDGIPREISQQDKKHLTSHASTVVYAAHSGDAFHVLQLDVLQPPPVPSKVSVFPQRSALKVGGIPSIAALTIIPEGQLVAIVDGIGQSLSFYALDSKQVIRNVPLHKTDLLLQLQYSPGESCLYYGTDNHVGILSLKEGERKLQFPHPCRVLKVLGCGKRFVVTLAEDNVLRIWDQMMHPFTPDVSAYSGKVAVRSEASMKDFQSILDTFSSEFSQDLEDTRAILTTEDVRNYWTNGVDNITSFPVTTKFLPMTNTRYLAVSQVGHDPSNARVSLRRWTHCITVWDLVTMSCVKRLFPPLRTIHFQLVHPGENAMMFTDLGDDGSPLYQLMKKGEEFEMKMVYGGPDKVKPATDLIEVPQANAVVAENTAGKLFVFDMGSRQVRGHLEVKSGGVNSDGSSKFQMIKVIPDTPRILAVYSNRFAAVWDTQLCQLLGEVDLQGHLPGLSRGQGHKLGLQFSRDLQYAVLTADSTDSAGNSKGAAAATILDVNKVKIVGTICETARRSCITTAILLRCGRNKLLQLIGVDSGGNGHVLDQVSLGVNANRLLVAADQARCVTWCDESREQSLKYWAVLEAEQRLQLLGSFSADDEIDEVELIDGGRAIVVSSPSGLVRLSLSGRDVPPYDHRCKDMPIIFKEVELNVELHI